MVTPVSTIKHILYFHGKEYEMSAKRTKLPHTKIAPKGSYWRLAIYKKITQQIKKAYPRRDRPFRRLSMLASNRVSKY